ncbi:hypothetical protein ACU8KH_00166 [Lachancea thermotolerans]
MAVTHPREGVLYTLANSNHYIRTKDPETWTLCFNISGGSTSGDFFSPSQTNARICPSSYSWLKYILFIFLLGPDFPLPVDLTSTTIMRGKR